MKTLINALKAYTDSKVPKMDKSDKAELSPITAKDDMTQPAGVRMGKLWTAPYRLTKNKLLQALGYVPVNETVVGKAKGIAALDENRKIPADQLPQKKPDTVVSDKFEVIGEPYTIQLLDGDGRFRSECVYPLKAKNNAFKNSALEINTLPYGLEVVGDYAFASCSNLKVKELPPHLRTLGYGAFEWDKGLVTTKLPDTLESIG